MQITDEQKAIVTQWVKEGCGLSEIQRRLADQLKLTMTYMDVRFLVIELGLNIKEQKKPVAPVDLRTAAPAAPPPPGPGADDMAEFEPEPAMGGNVTVEVDRVVRAGAVVSGTVTFSDGVHAAWSLDQMGRLALATSDRKEYRPTQADAQAFQQSVVRELRKRGYG